MSNGLQTPLRGDSLPAPLCLPPPVAAQHLFGLWLRATLLMWRMEAAGY